MISESSFLSHFWQGYFVKSYQVNHEKQTLQLTLNALPEITPICSQCGQHCNSIHDYCIRNIRDSDFLEYKTYLQVPIRRVNCPSCGPKTEYVSWLDKYSRLTSRLVWRIAILCRILPLSHIAELYGLSWSTVRNIDERRLQTEVKKPDYSSVSQLVMDEFALHKGHRYATVVADAVTMEVLWVGEGRSRENIRPFFEELGDYRENIQAVAMDMNTSFDLEVKEQCPKAEVVFDLFHVIAKYGREVIDRVRVDRANELNHDKKARKAVKRGRWLLLRNRNNLTETQNSKLEKLLSANEPLALVYVLKEQLKEIWRAKTVWAAYKKFKEWYKLAKESSLKPLIDFARKLRPYFRGIVSAAKYPLNTSCLEGINNKIKLIKRMGYGFRNTNYFFLKIRAAFPGNQ